MANKSLYVHNGLTVGSSVEINGTSGNVLTSGIVTTTNTTNASSTITGALQVRGGAGIGGNLYVGGTIFGNIDATVQEANTIATTARTTNAAHYLTFVDSNNGTAAYESVYTTSSFVVNPSTGNVGIGTTAPATTLDVNGDVTIADKIIHSGDTNTSIRFPAADTFSVETNGSERMRIDSLGRVGIGTSSPGIKLDISDTFTDTYTSSSTSLTFPPTILRLTNTDLTTNYTPAIISLSARGAVSTISTWYLGNDGGAGNYTGSLVFGNRTGSTSYQERMRIDGNGNVGIGTSSPASRLNVVGGSLATTGGGAMIAGDIATGRLLSGGGNTIQAVHTYFDSQAYEISAGSSNGYVTGIGIAARSYTGTGADAITLWTRSAERMRIDSSGNVGIGTTSTTYKLEVNGSFAAVTKSFVINHPTKPGMKLRYGSLEGPENGVYVRGRLKGSNKIELPDYWTGLVDEETITVNLTPIGKHQKLYVEDIADNIVIVGNDNLLNKEINCFYTVFAERKDVDKLDVEI